MKLYMQNSSVNKSNWQISYSRSAEKFLSKLDDKNKRKILDKIASLIVDDKGLDIKHLINTENEYRLRVGDYRIIYARHEQVLIIEIIKIGNRKDVYK